MYHLAEEIYELERIAYSSDNSLWLRLKAEKLLAPLLSGERVFNSYESLALLREDCIIQAPSNLQTRTYET